MKSPGPHSSRLFVIGASAGGFEAMRQLLSQLPVDFPAPILLVIHVPIDSRGQTSAVLQRSGDILVIPAIDGALLKSGHVYVAPPNYHLVVDDSRMRLSSGPLENNHRPAIDPLFRSAAQVYGPNAVGIILSGYLDDGAAGLYQIKQAGGITIVQDPEDAIVPDMPLNAFERLKPDHSVPIRDLGSLMNRLASESSLHEKKEKVLHVNQQKEQDSKRTGSPSVFTCPECHGTLWEENEGETLKFRCRVGHAFTADTMLEDQGLDVERALWAALRVLEEHAELANRLAVRARKKGHSLAHKQYENRTEESKRNARVLRDLLSDRPQIPRPARPMEVVDQEASAD